MSPKAKILLVAAVNRSLESQPSMQERNVLNSRGKKPNFEDVLDRTISEANATSTAARCFELENGASQCPHTQYEAAERPLVMENTIHGRTDAAAQLMSWRQLKTDQGTN